VSDDAQKDIHGGTRVEGAHGKHERETVCALPGTHLPCSFFRSFRYDTSYSSLITSAIKLLKCLRSTATNARLTQYSVK
jgi:hypothetical protein